MVEGIVGVVEGIGVVGSGGKGWLFEWHGGLRERGRGMVETGVGVWLKEGYG